MPKIRVGNKTAVSGGGVSDLADLNDVSMTGTQLEDGALFGAANHEYIPCIPMVHDNYPILVNEGNWLFASTGTKYLRFALPLPTTRNGLKLYVDGWEMGLQAADINHYVDYVRVIGCDTLASTNEDENGTNQTTTGRKTDTFTAIDMSGYYRVVVSLKCVVTSVNSSLKITYVNLRCYYA